MRRLLSALALSVIATVSATPAAALVFSFESHGFAIPSDCDPSQFPPFPACAVLDVAATANDVPDVIPGQWNATEHGQVNLGFGAGTFLFDDPSPANNDFFGTWTNVLFPPNASGISVSNFEYVVTGGSGVFAGATGTGQSSLVVVTAPEIGPSGPFFNAACSLVAPGIGGYCERGVFSIPEPTSLAVALLALALVALAVRSRTRQRGARARGSPTRALPGLCRGASARHPRCARTPTARRCPPP